MTIEIQKPELERLMREEIRNGHFQSMDELLIEALQALREKNAPPAPASVPARISLNFCWNRPLPVLT